MTGDLTDRITSLAATIGAHLNDDEKTAQAASAHAPWKAASHESDNWIVTDPKGWPVIYDEGTPNLDEARHIARNDPRRALRRVAATRSLVAAILKEPHDWNPLDEYYSCSQAEDPDPCPGEGGPGSGCSDPDRAGQPCDCGRDARVARLLGIIESEWDAQDG